MNTGFSTTLLLLLVTFQVSAQITEPCSIYSEDGIVRFYGNLTSRITDNPAKTIKFWFEHESDEALEEFAKWAKGQGYRFTMKRFQVVSEFDTIGNAIVDVQPSSIEISKEVSEHSEQFYSTTIKQVGSKKQELGIKHCGAISNGYE